MAKQERTEVSSADGDLDREIAFHLEELTAGYRAQGFASQEAQRRAAVDFGGREQIKQRLREVHTSALLDAFVFHLRAALRFLRQSPAFSVAAVATLALGIGANSAVFSALDAVVLRALPFPRADRLMQVSQRNDRSHDANRFVASVRLEDWNRLNATFAGLTGYYKDDLTETSGALPERFTEAMVAPRFFDVMGVSPVLGRAFRAEEQHFGGPHAVVISYRLWRGRFNGNPHVLGQALHIGKAALPIVGVMPEGFRYPDRDVDLWEPSPVDAPYAQSRDSTWFSVVGRLQPGVTEAQAQANLATVQHQLGMQFPKSDADLRVDMVPLKETIVSGVRDSLWLLYGSVSLLLLIACSNLAALLLARTADREHEIAVRFALGASRRAVMGQLLAEVFALAVLGALFGLLVAAGTLDGLRLLAAGLPRGEEIALNWRVLLYSLGCAVATTFVCGLYPALRSTRRELARSMAQTGRTQSAPRGTMQWWLVGVQVALAVVLLTGAGLLLRSLQALGRVSPGFETAHVLTFHISGSWGETGDMKRLIARTDRTLDVLRALPGVEAASTAGALPGMPGKFESAFRIDGHNDAAQPVLADARSVSAGYFATLHIPLLAGEACREGSTTSDFLVNRSFVDRYFGHAPALGHMLAVGAQDGYTPPGQIRGIVADAREDGLNTPPAPTVYYCFSTPTAAPDYLVRTRGDARAMAEPIRQQIHALEPARSVYAMELLQQHLHDSGAENRLRTVLLIAFGSTAIALACIGLYGSLNYLGRVREREIGLRLTLGASRGAMARRFLFQGLRVTALGCAAGALGSLFAGRLLATMLFGISALDAPTYVGVLLLVLAMAALACALPARRAARVEPATVLRGS